MGRNIKREELPRQIVERNISSAWRFEAECFDIMGNIRHFEELEFANPADLARRRVVLLVARRFRSKKGGCRLYLDVLASGTGTGKTLSESQKKLRISFEADLSREDCADQARLLR